MYKDNIPAAIHAHIQALLPQIDNWQHLNLGNTSNTLYRGEGRGVPCILRINASPERSFGVNRNQEDEVLTLIADYSWAPRILCNDVNRGFCLMAYHGEPDADIAVTRKAVFQALAELQMMIEGPGFDYPHLFELYREQLAADTEGLSALTDLQLLLAQLPEDRCLIHQDLHPGNVLVFEGKVTLIDWEYAGVGSVWMELANVQRYWHYTVAELAELPLCRRYRVSDIQHWLGLADQCNRLMAKLWYLARG